MAALTTRISPTPPSEACGLERLPHVMNKVCLMWGQPECDAYINRLIMDSRDGNRQGLPWEAAMDLMLQRCRGQGAAEESALADRLKARKAGG